MHVFKKHKTITTQKAKKSSLCNYPFLSAEALDEHTNVIDGYKNSKFQKQNNILISKEILKGAFRNRSIIIPQI